MKQTFEEILEGYHVQLENNRLYESIKLAAELYAQQSTAIQEGESVLSAVTEIHAKEIIKAGYPAFFKSGNWHLTDESDALKEPCKKLLCKTKSFCFWFFNDKIDIDFTDGGIEATFDDINFDVRYRCYIKAAELGYNIPGLRRTPQESKEGVEEDEINTEFRMIISHALLGCDTKDISRETFDLMVSECTKYSFKLLGYPHPPKS